jgi:glycosyltransferase involved in cell wall biosynthesis
MSEPIKVLHVVEAVEGGVVRHVRDLVTFGTGASHAVAMPKERHGYFTDFAALAEIEAAVDHTLYVDMRRSVASPRNPAAVRRIARFADSWSPDVVHGHATIGGVAARLVATRRRDRVAVWTPNGVLAQRAAVLIERGLARLTDRIIAVSSSEAHLLRELSIATAKQLAVIPNGIDLDPASVDPPSLHELCGIPAGSQIVGCIARLSEQKGIDTFIATARIVLERVPAAWFVLIGSGDLAPLARDAEQTLSRFSWIDGLAGAGAVQAQLSVFALLSRYEGLPYVLMEAAAAGTPCVVTDAVGNRDIIANEASGLLVPIDDAAAAADAIVRVLTDGALHARLSKGAKARAQSFDARTMARQTVALYEDSVRATRG